MLKLATDIERKYYEDFMYPWQDEIFSVLRSEKFYLTGGTCLSRFYYQHRYSDDLDFFFDGTMFSREEFEADFRVIINEIGKAYKYQLSIDSEHFKQAFLIKDQYELKIDFVYEPVKSIGARKHNGVIVIDNKENLVSNKLSTIYNRKTSKDYTDLFYLLQEYHLEEVIRWAEEKMVPLDYESTILCLVDGTFQGDVCLTKAIDENQFISFTKGLIQDLLNHAKKVR